MSYAKCCHPSPFASGLWLHSPGACPPSPPLAYSFTAPELDYYANPPSPIVLSSPLDESEEDPEATQKYTPPVPSPETKGPPAYPEAHPPAYSEKTFPPYQAPKYLPSIEETGYMYVKTPFWNCPSFSFFKREPKKWTLPHPDDLPTRIRNLVSCWDLSFVGYAQMRNGTECWTFKGQCPLHEGSPACEGYGIQYKRNPTKRYALWKCFRDDSVKNAFYIE